jgi:adenylate cyclase
VKNLLGLLDEITKEIVTALQVQLTWGDFAQAIAATDNFEAWTYFNKCYRHYQLRTKRDEVKARELCERAVELDPKYVPPLVAIAGLHIRDAQRKIRSGKPHQQFLKRAIEVAQKAHSIDESDPGVHTIFSLIYRHKEQYEKALAAAEKAIELDPNYAFGYQRLAYIMYYSGRFEEAIELIKHAMRLHGPYFPPKYLAALNSFSFHAGHCEESLEAAKKLQERKLKGEWHERAYLHLRLARPYICLGQVEEARKHAGEALRLNPRLSLEFLRKRLFLSKRNPSAFEREIDAYRKMGIPEKAPSK